MFCILQNGLATFTTIYHNNIIKNNYHKSLDHKYGLKQTEQGKQNNEEAERLARRNERGRQRRLDEIVEEREIRLAKRREAWKNKNCRSKM